MISHSELFKHKVTGRVCTGHKGIYGKYRFLLLVGHPKQVLVCSFTNVKMRPNLMVLARLPVTGETRHLQENMTLVKHGETFFPPTFRDSRLSNSAPSRAMRIAYMPPTHKDASDDHKRQF